MDFQNCLQTNTAVALTKNKNVDYSKRGQIIGAGGE